ASRHRAQAAGRASVRVSMRECCFFCYGACRGLGDIGRRTVRDGICFTEETGMAARKSGKKHTAAPPKSASEKKLAAKKPGARAAKAKVTPAEMVMSEPAVAEPMAAKPAIDESAVIEALI